MSSRILAFPTEAAAAVRHSSGRHAAAPPASAPVLIKGAQPPGWDSSPGPWLIHSRAARDRNQTQAQRIARQVEGEIAARVQREAAQRRGVYQMPSPGKRGSLSTLPPQATEVGLRHRLLDALLFFARPA